MDIQKSNINAQQVAFSGHKKFTDKTGFENHSFYYLYDPQKYTCEVELYNISKDKNKNLTVKNPGVPAAILQMKDGKVSEDISELSEISSELGFAYRFKLTDKATGDESFAFDNGTVYNIKDTGNTDNKFNIILNNRATINKNGAMQLIMPDEYYPGVVNVDGKPEVDAALRAKALTSVRNHANKLGGNFYGIIKRLPEIEKEGIKRIVGTPFTRDTISSHLYWTENAYQTAPDLGNEEDYKALQTELFKHGINWISDAALVNEGFGGIHLSELLRKGSDSISKNMFRAGERISLGILPDKCDYTRMKIINAPFTLTGNKYEPGNPNYDPGKPTYIQFYDERLASPEQVASDSPFRMSSYDNKNTDNLYDITKHDDAVYPFPIEVSPSQLERNIKRISAEKGTVDFSDIGTIKEAADFKNFNVVTKSQNAGLEVWDGNVDIAKLNFYRNPKDDTVFKKLPKHEQQAAMEDFKRGTLAVRDYAVNSGKYWTGLTADIQLKYASSLFKGTASDADSYMASIKTLVSNGELPKSTLDTVDKEVIENVLDENYNLRTIYNKDLRSPINPDAQEGNDYTFNDYLLKKALDVPYETLPFATNLLGVITSPYIAKKANTDDEIGVSRFDTLKAGNPDLPEKYASVYNQTEDLYNEKIVPLMQTVLSEVPGLKDDDGNISEYGRYVVSEVASDVTRYLLVKSVNPNADIEVSDKGDFDFTKVNPEEITMQSIGIPYEGKTSEEEAQALVDIIDKGLDEIDVSDLKSKVAARFENRTLNDFKVAEMIMDQTDSGLGWRIDAAKDVASIDAVRSDVASMTETWNNVIDFWKRYNDAVLEINPHAYTTAEITDLAALFSEKDTSVFYSDSDAERKFLQETGITSVANYNYFFSLLPDLFSEHYFESGLESSQAKNEENRDILSKLVEGWCEYKGEGANPGFLFQSPDDGVTNSYTFVGNHDKPRVLHNLSLDMGLYTSSLSFDEFPTEKIEEFAKDNNQGGIDWIKGVWANDTKRKVDYIRTTADVLKEDLSFVDFDKLDSTDFYNINDREEFDNILADCNYPAINSVIDLDKVNSKAIAMGSRLNDAFKECVSDPDLYEKLTDAVKDLATGNFKGKNFDADAFGTRPFEIAIKSVFDQVEYKGDKVADREELEAKVLETILTPAYDRFFAITKLLTTLPGSPTDFAGDRTGNTGFETKAKNYHQQNRNIIHWEWLKDGNDNKYAFIKNFYNKMNEISGLRTRPELSALNDGATVALPVLIDADGSKMNEADKKLQMMLRYNDKGSVVLTLHNLNGASTPFNQRMNRTDDVIKKKIVFNPEGANAKQGLKHGIKPGTKFKNARSEDTSVYRVVEDKNGYTLKRFSAATGDSLPIVIKPEDLNTMILYKAD